MNYLNYDALVRACLTPRAALPHPKLLSAFAPEEGRAVRVRGFVEEMRERAHTRHVAGAPGLDVVKMLSRLTDQLVMALFEVLAREHAVAGGGVALFAMGGYGREELSPHSDLDMLILHEEGLDLKGLAEGLLYPLWDAGLDVQCVARTIKDNLRVCREDHRSRTSLLEARLIGGDRELAARFDREVLEKEVFRRGMRAFVKVKVEEMQARYQRYGDTVYRVEPNLKEGQGGLRDIQTAYWVAKLRYGVRSMDELFRSGPIPAEEIKPLEEARDFLLRVRNFLHFRAGRRDDRLGYESQEEAARAFGYDQGDVEEAAERFLRDFYICAGRVKHFAEVVIRRACRGRVKLGAGLLRPKRNLPAGVSIERGEVELDEAELARDPLLLIQVFEAAQRYDAPLSPETLGLVRDNLHRIDDRFRRDPRAVEIFLRILRHPRRVATTMLRMQDVRFLDRFIPEFKPIFCRVTREINHVFPVDVHSLFTVQELRRLARGEYDEAYPLAARLMAGVARVDVLYLAALLHDVGKGGSGPVHNHAEKGAQLAVAVGDRMGLRGEELELLVFLVRRHLSLSATAQGRDLHDEELIDRFARDMGEVEALDLLYLLTFADVRAVAPEVLNQWKLALFDELYHKARTAIELDAITRPGVEGRAEQVADALRRHPPEGMDEAALAAFLDGVDHPAYLLSWPLETLRRHAAAFADLENVGAEGAEPLVTHVRPVENEGHSEVLLVTRDRPGLFADLAGVTAAHNLNILSAALNTRTDGWVLDVLHLASPTGEIVTSEHKWKAWKADLTRVVADEAASREAERKFRRAQTRRRPVRGKDTLAIRFDNEASRRFTVIDVAAKDRLGLLYDISRVVTDFGLTIRLAKIATTLERAADSFYVERLDGGKLTKRHDLTRLKKELERCIREGEA